MRSNVNIFDRLSFLSLFLVIILLPFFVLPFTNIPIEIAKGLLLVVGLAFCIIFWAIARFFDGEINLPRSVCLLGGGGVVLVFLLSAIFSQTSQVSFFGTMLDVGSFWFIFGSFMLMFCSSIIFRTPKQAKTVLFGAILSSALVLIFQSVHLFFPEALSLGLLSDKTDNVLGSWNALGLFAGFSALISLLVVEFFSTTKLEKLILGALTILSIVLVAIVNFSLVWLLLGIFSLIIFVYKVSIISKEDKAEVSAITPKKKVYFPAFSFSIIMITLLFFISGPFVGGILPNSLGIQNNDVSPSFLSTMSVTKSVLKESPVLGLGPNKFSSAWASYKPLAMNVTSFWDITFNSGSGLLPTLTSTTGLLGILAWLVFFVLLIVSGMKSIFSSIKNGVNWETMAFFVLSLYLFISSFFYSTGMVIFLLALAFAGVFVGLSSSNATNGKISLSFFNDHRKRFFSILLLVLIIIVPVVLSFKYVERFASVFYFRKALTTKDIPVAEASIDKALKLYENDLYLRAYSQIYLIKLNSLVAKDAASLSSADRASMQSSLDQAVSGAQLAVKYDPTNYVNFQTLGSVYQTAAAFGAEDGYDKAIEFYTMASNLNPLNPGLKLSMAATSLSQHKNKEAKDYANAALLLKPDYINAFIVLSQIATLEGDNTLALNYAQKALAISPTNTDLIKYKESLKTPAPAPDSKTTTKKP
ncbi:MAG: hypothetical protein V4699_01025 [Patescibacteria group bacterium]